MATWRLPPPLTQPWAISEYGMHLVLAIATRGQLFAEARELALAARQGQPLDNTRATQVRDGVAIIPVMGPLFRHASMFDEVSGATSYADIRRDLQAALEAPEVRAILLEANSPGGEVDGVAELGDALVAARSKKRLWTYIGGMGASAMYWLASATDRIVCSETAMLGSIGVRSALVDESGANDKAGIRITEIVSSQSPAKRDQPVDDTVVARQQAHADQLAAIFIETVARNRGVTVEHVVEGFGRGDVLIGERAVAAGLADEMNNDFEAVLAALAAEAQLPLPAATGGTPMTRNANKSAAAAAAAGPAATSASASAAEAEPAPMDGKGAEGEEDDMVQCLHCKGSGEMPDASKCEVCGGSGKVQKAGASAEHDEPDDDDKRKDGDKDKAAARADSQARANLAALVGLPPTASLGRIAAVAGAKLVPLTALADLRRDNAALASRLERIEAEGARAAGEAFVERAIADGRTVAEKKPHLVAEYVRAEKARAGGGPAALEPQLFEKGRFTVARILTRNGTPVGKPDLPPADFAQDSPEAIRAAVADKAKEIALAEKISFGKAMTRVQALAPELYAAYAALR